MNKDEFTISEQFLDVGDGHKLYIQDWGNKNAKLPIIFLHGGPGSGVKDSHRQRFDPSKQRVIFFDQRGSGKSTPVGALVNNNTQKLIQDIKKIIDHFHLEDFVINGGSWGSCLALAYAMEYPGGIKAMVLSGIFTGTKKEINHIDKGKFRNFFPDIWQKYTDTVPKEYQDNPSTYHYRQLESNNPNIRKKSIFAHAILEGSLCSLDDRFTPSTYDEFEPESHAIEMHYLANACFMPEGYIMENAHQLKMSVWLVQGRYDMVCPPATAYELHAKLPNSQLIWTTAGHGNDRPNYDVVRSILLQMTL